MLADKVYLEYNIHTDDNILDKENIEILNSLANTLSTIISVVAKSLVYLYTPGWSVQTRLIHDEQKPDNICIEVVVLNPEQGVDKRYVVNNIKEFVDSANNNVIRLFQANPNFSDNTYLIGVGIEQGLQQYQQQT